jgi:hypothetical protein
LFPLPCNSTTFVHARLILLFFLRNVANDYNTVSHLRRQ